MTNFDFTPLYRSTIGFDRLAHLIDTAFADTGREPGFPAYDIIQADENRYRINLTVAGFAEQDLTVEQADDRLVVKGRKQGETDTGRFLHHGIAARDFTREFRLADHVKVVGANLMHGLLTIDLVREVPEEMKPRQIEIRQSAPAGLGGKLIDKAKKLLSDGTSKAA